MGLSETGHSASSSRDFSRGDSAELTSSDNEKQRTKSMLLAEGPKNDGVYDYADSFLGV